MTLYSHLKTIVETIGVIIIIALFVFMIPFILFAAGVIVAGLVSWIVYLAIAEYNKEQETK